MPLQVSQATLQEWYDAVDVAHRLGKDGTPDQCLGQHPDPVTRSQSLARLLRYAKRFFRQLARRSPFLVSAPPLVEATQAIHSLTQALHVPLFRRPLPGSTCVPNLRAQFSQGTYLVRALQLLRNLLRYRNAWQ